MSKRYDVLSATHRTACIRSLLILLTVGLAVGGLSAEAASISSSAEILSADIGAAGDTGDVTAADGIETEPGFETVPGFEAEPGFEMEQCFKSEPRTEMEPGFVTEQDIETVSGFEMEEAPLFTSTSTEPYRKSGMDTSMDLLETSLVNRNRWDSIPVDGEIIALRSPIPVTGLTPEVISGSFAGESIAGEGLDEAETADWEISDPRGVVGKMPAADPGADDKMRFGNRIVAGGIHSSDPGGGSNAVLRSIDAGVSSGDYWRDGPVEWRVLSSDEAVQFSAEPMQLPSEPVVVRGAAEEGQFGGFEDALTGDVAANGGAGGPEVAPAGGPKVALAGDSFSRYLASLVSRSNTQGFVAEADISRVTEPRADSQSVQNQPQTRSITTIEAAGVTASLSSDEVAPNDLFTVTLRVDDPVDLYYFSTVVMFDPVQLEYVSLEKYGITADGIHVQGQIAPNLMGVAVSRTDTEHIIQSGDFMVITFRVRPMAETGPIELTFMDSQMSDSAGDPIDFTDLEPAELDVVAGIGMAELAIPPASAVTEGESFFAKGRVHASGVTTVDEEEIEEAQERISAWIGVSEMDSDPELWDESAWKAASLELVEDDLFTYSSEVALHRPVGDWYLAFRVELDEDGSYAYGGLDGFWDSNDSRSAHLEIERMAAFRYTLAAWDFEEARNLFPTQSIPANDSSELLLHGVASGSGSEPDTQSSEGTTWLTTRSWEDQAEYSEKYLHIAINTTRFEDLQLSSSHTATSAGPRLMGLELSLDGSQWEAHAEGELDLRNSSTIHLQNLALPDRYEDQEEVHIRWIRRSTERVGEEGGEVSSAGIHRIADIRITGTQMDPRRVHVLPGDINRDGVVNSQDVLQLGYYWLSRGPLPAYSFMDFQPREVETWVPEGATYADANGDGVVDHRDLQPIGLNFGKQREGEMEKRQIDPEEVLAGLALPPLKQGESMTIQLESDQVERLRGVAWRFSMKGIAGRLWRVESDEPAEWASSWSDQEVLLTFQKKQDEVFEEARVVRGRQHQDEEASQLSSVRIVAEADWPAPGHLMLDWVVTSRQVGTTYELEEVMLSVEQTDSDPADDERPEVTRLLQNFPNPFQSETSIHYELSEATQVRLEVFSINGKRVATLVDGYQETGRYAVSFDASGISSGVYLYRLVAGSASVTRSLVVVR